MRDLGTVLITAKELDPSIEEFSDLVVTDKYDTLVEAVKQRTGYDPVKNSYASPSFARNIGYDIDKVVAQIKVASIRPLGDPAMEERAAIFQELKRLSWTEDIKLVAKHDFEGREGNRQRLFPLASDVKKTSDYFKKQKNILE